MTTSFSPTESKSMVLWKSLEKFYAAPANLRALTGVLKKESRQISLRTLDWLCTNYAKKNNVTYLHNGKILNVYLDYKANLKAYKKTSFDPFQRHERVTIADADGNTLVTTIAQLCFFRWAISRGVLAYALANADKIEADNVATDRARGKETIKKKKRQELSKAATKTATKKNLSVVVTFK